MPTIELGTTRAYGTLSGYIYLHLPKQICQICKVKPKTTFVMIYDNGELILRQREEKDVRMGTG